MIKSKSRLIMLIICATFIIGCKQDQRKHLVKLGTYSSKNGNENIIILDSTHYIHKYKINKKILKDTSTYTFRKYDQNFYTIEFKDLFISDSSIYYDKYINIEGDKCMMIYMENYKFSFWSKPKTIIKKSLDVYQNQLYFTPKNN